MMEAGFDLRGGGNLKIFRVSFDTQIWLSERRDDNLLGGTFLTKEDKKSGSSVCQY